MKLAILAPGSRGDIQPYVALGRGLQRAGHLVRVVTTRDHAALVTGSGLQLRSVDIDVQAELRQGKVGAALESGKLLGSFREFVAIARRATHLLVEQGLAASQGVDALLVGFSGLFVGHALAAKLGLPIIQAYNVPLTPTAERPGALFPGLSFWPRRVTHRLSHKLTRQLMWQTMRAAGQQARVEVLGLPAAPRFGPFDEPALRDGLTLYGLSPAVFPKPADWGPNIHVTGYWFLDEPAGWSPSAALAAFLERGAAPVYIGFGSMSNRKPAATAELVLEALRATGQRAILHTGWGGMRASELPDTVLMVDDVPHVWLFPRMAAVVHHGGGGTTAAGLRSGVPSIVVPFHGDQPYWGRQVAELGAGPRPIPRRRLTARRLAQAIEAAVTDSAMRRRAAELGTAIRAEDGVARAVELIGRGP
jgi:UDP:flavonoid glycosyltransferase YjiC (YdhE family)